MSKYSWHRNVKNHGYTDDRSKFLRRLNDIILSQTKSLYQNFEETKRISRFGCQRSHPSPILYAQGLTKRYVPLHTHIFLCPYIYSFKPNIWVNKLTSWLYAKLGVTKYYQTNIKANEKYVPGFLNKFFDHRITSRHIF